MKIIRKLLTVNQFSRPGRKLAECRGIIMHYVGIPNQRAQIVWNYFENDCPRQGRYASAHYIVDLNGDIYQAIPDDEVAYHCGSSIPDPASRQIYTDWAREKFGRFASNPQSNSPNNCTIGIELCINAQGGFTPVTLNSAIRLVAKLLRENKLTIEDIGYHKQVVGWKNCPLPWVKNPALVDDFKKKVKNNGQ